jgi:hypothetical protein
MFTQFVFCVLICHHCPKKIYFHTVSCRNVFQSSCVCIVSVRCVLCTSCRFVHFCVLIDQQLCSSVFLSVYVPKACDVFQKSHGHCHVDPNLVFPTYFRLMNHRFSHTGVSHMTACSKREFCWVGYIFNISFKRSLKCINISPHLYLKAKLLFFWVLLFNMSDFYVTVCECSPCLTDWLL